MNKIIQVMLVDDHAVVRMGFKLLLESASDIKVVAEAENGEQAVRGYAEHHPDVVVMDITMPGKNGLEFDPRQPAGQRGGGCHSFRVGRERQPPGDGKTTAATPQRVVKPRKCRAGPSMPRTSMLVMPLAWQVSI